MSNQTFIDDLFTLTLDELQAKYMKPKNKDSLQELRRYYRKKLNMERAPDPVEPGRLSKTWEVSAFDRVANEWTTKLNHGYDHGPGEQGEIDGQQFITQAPPIKITPTRRKKLTRQDSLSIFAGDAQIGFRGEEPFHDETAMALFQQAVVELQPDNVIFTGDMIDLPAMSRWEQRPEWQHTTQAAIDRYSSFLAQTRANAPNAKIVVVHGNHEARMDTSIRRDAANLLGLRRANAEHELSVLTLQYLVRYEDFGVESVDGYPNAAYWLEDNLKVTHGTNVKKGGSNANKYLNEEEETTIFGHTHRLEIAYKTIATRLGQRVIAAASPGCLARTDGYVPGFHYSVNNEGATVPRAEDWQQGILAVYHNPKKHDIFPIRFIDGSMNLLGRIVRLGE